MIKNQSRLAVRLLEGTPQSLTIFGTSLSYHLAPILRSAFRSRFGDIASVVNSGIAGRASRTALATLNEKVIEHKSDTLLMEWAINDAHDYHHEPGALDQGISPEESRENLNTLVSRVLAALPSAEIILWTPNAPFDAEGSTMRGKSARPHLPLYCQGIYEVASARGLRLIDGEKFWNSTHESLGEDFCALIPDGVHPTPKALREYFVPFLLDELGVPAQIL